MPDPTDSDDRPPPRRARAGTRPPGRPRGRPSQPVRLLPARLVPLTAEHERAALDALAALLAHDDQDHEEHDDEGGDT